MEYKLISVDEVPKSPDRIFGWVNIIKDFLRSGEKCSYIQFDTKEEMRKASGGLSASSRRYKVRVSQRSHLIRVYLERL